MADDPHPSISLVVVTRDRPRDLEVCLRAVTSSTVRDFELVVVDQSASSDSADIVRNLAARDRRVHYLPDKGQGAARARNLGTAATHADLIVFTDDDCEPQPDWLGAIVCALRDDPRAGIAYGSVIPRVHDPRHGFIVGFLPRRRMRLEGRLSKLREAGIGANVAVRRAALEATGGFDEMLGPGSYFPCAEDFDLTYRVLSKGYALLIVPEARVVHHGLRDWQTGSALVRRTYVAIGAAYMKHARLGDMVGLLLVFHELCLAVLDILRHVARGKGPFGFGRLRGLLTGVCRSFELDIERGRALYVPVQGARPPATRA